MKNEFENQLTRALRPAEPSDDFAERVMSRIASESVREPLQVLPSRSPRLRWLTVALAASVVLSAVITYQWQVRREREGLEARKQLIEALRVTGEKLDLAYRVVNSKSTTPIAPPNDTGAES